MLPTFESIRAHSVSEGQFVWTLKYDGVLFDGYTDDEGGVRDILLFLKGMTIEITKLHHFN